MRPITDIGDLRVGNVLHHSAFGFAAITRIGATQVELAWERSDSNLPKVVSHDTLRRVYSVCPAEGFFHRSFSDRDGLAEYLQVDPVESTALLLADLPGPQERGDLRDWLVSRDLMSGRTFARWWDHLKDQLDDDARFAVEGDVISLAEVTSGDVALSLLDDPGLKPARRMDLALANREQLGEDRFLAEAVLAWRSGNESVMKLAMLALKKLHPQRIMEGLLAPGPDNLAALTFAIQRAGWSPAQFDKTVRKQLLIRLHKAASEGGLMDQEARFATALAEWGLNGVQANLVNLLDKTNGQRLVAAMLGSYTPRRTEAFTVSLLERAIHRKKDGPAKWLAEQLIAATDLSVEELADSLQWTNRTVAKWLRDGPGTPAGGLRTESPKSLELEMVPVDRGWVPLGELPQRSGSTFLGFAVAIVRKLAQSHVKNLVLTPRRDTFAMRSDGVVQVQKKGDPARPTFPHGGPASKVADVHATAALLVEALLGRRLPEGVDPVRVLPYLRLVVDDLPPSAMAPLLAALQPEPARRPPDGRAWLALWEYVAQSERARARQDVDAEARLEIGYDTHVGMGKILKTQTNQDALYAATRANQSVMVVCDGISTASAGSGDIASGISANVISSMWEQSVRRLAEATDEERTAFVDRALGMANRAVCEAALRYAGGNLDGRVPMGTTALCALTHGNAVHLAWLGDSPGYLVGPYGASLLTADMNQAGERFVGWQRGQVSVWEPAGPALIGYLGHFNDAQRPVALQARHATLRLLPGERLVLCSDGITDYLAPDPSSIADAVHKLVDGASPQEAALDLVAQANRGGGGDNATAIVAMLAPGDEEDTEES